MHCSPVQLSPREREIVAARAKGRACKQIADELKISLNTVKTHLARIFVKLDVQCSLELLQRMQANDCEHCPYARGAIRVGRRAKLATIILSPSRAGRS